MSNVTKDILLAARGFRRQPIWALSIVMVLALGMAANVAMFAGFDAWVLRDLDLKQPEELVSLQETQTRDGGRFAARARNYEDWRQRQTAFVEMAAFVRQVVNVDDEAEPARAQGVRISAELFPMIGAEPLLGRLFGPSEDVAGQPAAVALIGHRLWQERYRGDRQVLGNQIRIDGVQHQIVGVMEPGFQFPEWGQVWVPLGLDPYSSSADSEWLSIVARLAPGVSFRQAQESMTGVAEELERQRPDENEGWGVLVQPLRDQWVPDVIEVALTASLLAALLVLLVICANVTTLMMVQSEATERESAVRSALGANRWQLVRPMLIGNGLLALAAGALGVVMSRLWVTAMLGRIPLDPPYLFSMKLDHRTALFTLLLCVVAAVVCALAPLVRLGRVETALSLRSSGGVSSRRGARLRTCLVVGELALSTALVVGALLMVKSFAQERLADLGYDAEGALAVDLSLTGPELQSPQERVSFIDRVEAGLAASPTVTALATTTSLPASDRLLVTRLEAEGQPVERNEGLSASLHGVTRGYFEALGVPLLAGRDFFAAEVAEGADVAVLGKALASRLWPGESVIGRRVRSVGSENGQWLEVIGVVGDVDPASSMVDRERPRRQIYRPFGSLSLSQVTVALRSPSPPRSLILEVQEAVRGAGSRVPISELLTLRQSIDRSQWVTRFFSEQMALYGLIALLIAAFGLYGLVAEAVSRRKREVALRVALGAQRRELLAALLGREMVRAATGVVLGLGLALLFTRFGASMLSGVEARDPVVFVGVALLLAVTALVASYLPARRCLRVDVASSLRGE